jgi:hypothetical protein
VQTDFRGRSLWEAPPSALQSNGPCPIVGR